MAFSYSRESSTLNSYSWNTEVARVSLEITDGERRLGSGTKFARYSVSVETAHRNKEEEAICSMIKEIMWINMPWYTFQLYQYVHSINQMID